MKKVLFIALAMLIAGTTAMAQSKKPQNKKAAPQPTAITVTDNGAKAVKPFEKVIFELPPVEVGLDVPLRESLEKRRTVRQFNSDELPIELISSLLWTAYGFNRPDEEKRVVPSAVNAQEFDIYLFNREGVYLYNAAKNNLEMVAKGDYRSEISSQKHFSEAPVSIVLVAN